MSLTRNAPPESQLESFPPVVGPHPSLLVLGSMPGEKSLAAAEYYAHPRNRFWPLMRELAGVDPEAPYPDRLEELTGAGVALWDVLARCRRPGSLDQAIVPGSEVPNDIDGLLRRNPTIGAVALNGGKAAQSFRRFILPGLPAERRDRLAMLPLPSTSPANARWGLADLTAEWVRAFRHPSRAR